MLKDLVEGAGQLRQVTVVKGTSVELLGQLVEHSDPALPHDEYSARVHEVCSSLGFGFTCIGRIRASDCPAVIGVPEDDARDWGLARVGLGMGRDRAAPAGVPRRDLDRRLCAQRTRRDAKLVRRSRGRSRRSASALSLAYAESSVTRNGHARARHTDRPLRFSDSLIWSARWLRLGVGGSGSIPCGVLLVALAFAVLMLIKFCSLDL